MTKYAEVPATVEHAASMAPRMRATDAAEVWAARHVTPLESLVSSVETSTYSRAFLADDLVVCIHGVHTPNLLSDYGIMWALTANEVEDHVVAFLRQSKRFVAEFYPRYRLLLNFVDARHTMAVRWLQWLGFTVYPAEPFGMDKLPFHKVMLGEP